MLLITVDVKKQSFSTLMAHQGQLILLHGPPGCGKTTLCRALAQKLCIRLVHHFPAGGLLVELNPQVLLSKFYSESGALVHTAFEHLGHLADATHIPATHPPSSGVAAAVHPLVCVLMDEVETIASSRTASNAAGECQDGVRATNQLLTALDALLGPRANVVVLCTSNLRNALDDAFVDRMDVDVALPPPCTAAVYGILRRGVNALVAAGTVAEDDDDNDSELREVLPRESDRQLVPALEATLLLETLGRTDAPACVLARVAAKCVGYSGRRLRRLPLQAVSAYSYVEPCPLREAVAALERAVDDGVGKAGRGEAVEEA